MGVGAVAGTAVRRIPGEVPAYAYGDESNMLP